MNTPAISIIYFLVAAFFGALGQYLYKTGANEVNGGLISYLTNAKLLLGVACYFVVMILFVLAFKKGGQLSVLYPLYATTFIWGAIIAFFAFGVPIKPINIFGMILLIGGMYLMGK